VPKDTHRTAPADRAQLQLPEQVTVAVAELAGAAREGLLALAVGTGLQVLQAMLEEDVARLVGPKGRHNPARAAVRHGSEPGQVTLGGRRVRIRRPPVRSADDTRELPVPTYQAFAPTELLDQLVLERMLAKLSTRRYPAGLDQSGSALSRPRRAPPSRRFPAGSWPEPSMPWLSCWLATSPGWTWSRSWWTASEWPSTAVWSRSASPSMEPRFRWAGRGRHRERHRGG
jgi:putative transposase